MGDEFKKPSEKLRFIFNVVAEAKMAAFVKQAKCYVPPDQVKQYCETMLERALESEGVK